MDNVSAFKGLIATITNPTMQHSRNPKTTKRHQRGKNSPTLLVLITWPYAALLRFSGKGTAHKLFVILVAAIVLWIGGMYGIAQWYIQRHADEPLRQGVTFVPRYARYLNTDPQLSMNAMINDLGVRQFRLVSYWDDIEKTPGVYDFSELDWQFAKAEAANAKVSLAIGLRQPRWPECHHPQWTKNRPIAEWYPDLKNVMKATIERYKNSPALESYQLENEFFMKVFGICPDHTRERLIDEYHFVKSLDDEHPVIISRSNNWVGIPLYDPRPDQFAISVYKRVWDKTFTKRYFEYPLPAWFYAFLAGAGEIATGKSMIIHELQAESWLPEGYNMISAPSDELYKSMNPKRLQDRFEYGRATGMKEIYLWGAEWWYARMVNHDDASLWNVARDEFHKF